jgi:hypothetical protein
MSQRLVDVLINRTLLKRTSHDGILVCLLVTLFFNTSDHLICIEFVFPWTSIALIAFFTINATVKFTSSIYAIFLCIKK